ncbi:MAG TPA: FHA domain-containing protein [Thermoanaerobaculia bacterium]|nr:FHA domain-containing protein [Thermoanaerobaculia bacterium]
MQVRFGEFLFDSATRQVTRRGEPVRLAPKAFDLLQILIEERPRAVSKLELRDRLWPDVVVQEANLKNLVGEIRAALGDTSVIRTVHRHGYAFVSSADLPSRPLPARLLEGDRIHRLAAGVNVIGRDDDCAVIIDFTGVSRRHARITVGEARITLEDLGSKNGTFVNDVRVAGEVELRDRDRIRLGGLPLTFRSSSRPLTTATRRE